VNNRKNNAVLPAITVLVAALGASLAPLACAQTNSIWSGIRYEITPYVWVAGVSGTTRISPTIPVNGDALFSDITDSLSGGFMGTFEARKDRWGVLFDVFYIELSKQSRPLLNGTLGTATAEFKENIYQLAGTYRVSDDPATAVDVVLGVRHPSSDVDLTFSPSPLLPGGASRSGDKGWTDGFVGVRIGYKLSDKWTLTGYADIGTGGTEKSWQLLAGATYRFTDTVSAKFGYRILNNDFDETEFLHNVKTGGVYGGVGFSF
jgi:opacity protein-like surface antigen